MPPNIGSNSNKKGVIKQSRLKGIPLSAGILATDENGIIVEKEGVAGDTLFWSTEQDSFVSGKTWYEICFIGQYTGTKTEISTGTVYEWLYKGVILYRNITTAKNVRNYPVEDAFYSTFTGGTLSGLIAIKE